MKIKGIITSNLGEANENIKMQAPLFRRMPKKKLYSGTINLDIRPKKFKLLKWHYFFSEVDWGKAIEDFYFIKVRKLGKPNQLERVLGYLYLPSESPNFRRRSTLEIWTTLIEGINKGEEFEIEIPEGYLEINQPEKP
jgi:hypothetical protein